MLIHKTFTSQSATCSVLNGVEIKSKKKSAAPYETIEPNNLNLLTKHYTVSNMQQEESNTVKQEEKIQLNKHGKVVQHT